MWSTEVFKVSKVLDTKPLARGPCFMKDKEIIGDFYDHYLQKVKSIGI